ncbi:MAG: hypothetical protein H5T86_11035, partial [Armatimonadetes bacterium]|nr:hypothetical protein [Armatimonadota bacterium]
ALPVTSAEAIVGSEKPVLEEGRTIATLGPQKIAVLKLNIARDGASGGGRLPQAAVEEGGPQANGAEPAHHGHSTPAPATAGQRETSK